MEKMYILEIDAQGNQIRREYTEEEYAQNAIDYENEQIYNLELQKRKNARQSALNKLIDLGLTEEEIAAL